MIKDSRITLVASHYIKYNRVNCDINRLIKQRLVRIITQNLVKH